jgi:nucleotide-binding universal stress UspA family protein
VFKRILAASDIVDGVDPPVLAAARLARRHGARLCLLHVMESASTTHRHLVRHYASGVEMPADADYAQAVVQALRRTYREKTVDDPADMTVQVVSGFPWEAILRYSEDVDADLIVLGPHSNRAQTKGVVRVAGRVGSTVEHVLTREPCPVMIVNRLADEDQLRFRNVLVAVDFSRSCECAVCFAVRLATACRSRLLLFHMIPVPPIPKYSHAACVRDTAHARQRLESFYRPYLDGLDHQVLIRAGAMPHLEILKAAGENRADLILMGSHTKESAGKWYPGSAVERVGIRADCPVVVITDPRVLIRWEGRLVDTPRKTTDRLIHVLT